MVHQPTKIKPVRVTKVKVKEEFVTDDGLAKGTITITGEAEDDKKKHKFAEGGWKKRKTALVK